MFRNLCTFALLVALTSILSIALPRAEANQFPYLDPTYTQEIYTGPLVGGPGMAWTTSGDLLTRNGSDILEYSPTQNATHQGTAIHASTVTHTITGLSNTGYGMTNGLDGYIYTVTGAGLERFNPSNWAAPAQLLPGTVGGAGYGITTMPDGRIAYSDGSPTSNVYIYNPVANTNTLIYSGNSLIDGMVAGPLGNIAVTGQSNSTMTILTSTGSVVNSFSTPHFPDGLAFADSPSVSILYSNNNDGTITQYVMGPNFSGVPTITDIAGISGAYGDLASVGPDCAFYVSQFDNGGYHGSVAGVGTHWDNGVTNNEPSIIRIGGGVMPDGTTMCEFYSPLSHVPEPGTIGLLATGMMMAAIAGWRRRRSA